MRSRVAACRSQWRAIALCILASLAALLLGGQQKGQPLNTEPSGLKPLYGHMHALIVGIDKYPNVPQLHFAVADATATRVMLLKYGFKDGDITVLKNEEATQDAIRHSLEHFADADAVKPDDCILFIFSGHGATVTRSDGQMGYLLPYGAKVDLTNSKNEGPYRETCLSMKEVWDDLDISPAKHVLVIADACYSGLLAESKGLSKPEIDADLQGTVREVITAGGAGETAGEDSEHGHGYLTKALLDELRARLGKHEAFQARELADVARAKVLEGTNSRQKVRCQVRSGEGEFIFAPDGLVSPAVAQGDGIPVKRLPTEAVLSVTVTPADATIEVDGRVVGAQSSVETDASGKKSVVVNVSKPGFKSARFQVDVTAGQTSPLSVTLEAVGGGGASAAGLGIGSGKKSDKGGIDMVYVPAGEFTMGSDADDEKPVRKVTLDAFWIGKNDVTVAQFKAYCADQGIDFSKIPAPPWGWDGHDNHPMVNVTYEEAEGFCKWAGADLPTEAQWEKAARGDDGRVYPWGNDWDPGKLWWNQPASGGSTAPVGSFPGGKSPYGCLDMAGNVWQWCLDWYGPYDASATKNPTGAGIATNRVLRGGSWNNSNPDYFRCASRDSNEPTPRYNNYGFRLAGRS